MLCPLWPESRSIKVANFIESMCKSSALGGESFERYANTTDTSQVKKYLGIAGLEEKTPRMNFCKSVEDSPTEESVQVAMRVVTADLAVLIVLYPTPLSNNSVRNEIMTCVGACSGETSL